MKLSPITDRLKQYPLAIVCAGLILLCLIIIFLRRSAVDELFEKEAELTTQIQTFDKNVDNSKNLKQDTAAITAAVEKIDPLLFRRYERAININFFYGFEEKADVVISNISQSPQPDPICAKGGARALKLYSTLNYEIALNGSFANILKFFYQLDRDPSITRVTDFQITPAGAQAGGENMTARLSVLVLGAKE